MKILVVGSCGREHALAWRLAQAPGLQKVYVAPGNAGTAREQELENLPLGDINELADWAQREKVHATVVGPEAPLAAGIVDTFRARGLRIFGPPRAAAQLQRSKDFAQRVTVFGSTRNSCATSPGVRSLTPHSFPSISCA